MRIAYKSDTMMNERTGDNAIASDGVCRTRMPVERELEALFGACSPVAIGRWPRGDVVPPGADSD